MPRLIVTLAGDVLQDYTLTRQRTSIGRRPQNDVRIDHPAVSGEHACILTILNDSFLEDLDSTNGTWVNGQAVRKHFLKDGDVIGIGAYRLRFADEADLRTYSAMPQKTIEMQMPARPSRYEGHIGDTQLGDGPESTLPGVGDTESAGGKVARTGTIRVLSGPNAGREMPLVKALTTLGRAGTQAAVITRRARGFFITHVEGATATTVNGRAVSDQMHPLADQDLIEVGGIKMAFLLGGADERAL